jgi:hypothetical protein
MFLLPQTSCKHPAQHASSPRPLENQGAIPQDAGLVSVDRYEFGHKIQFVHSVSLLRALEVVVDGVEPEEISKSN